MVLGERGFDPVAFWVVGSTARLIDVVRPNDFAGGALNKVGRVVSVTRDRRHSETPFPPGETFVDGRSVRCLVLTQVTAIETRVVVVSPSTKRCPPCTCAVLCCQPSMLKCAQAHHSQAHAPLTSRACIRLEDNRRTERRTP